MAMRQKQAVLNLALKHFEEFGLPLDIDFKTYTAIVGPREAIHAMSVKRSFKAWKYLLHAVNINFSQQAPKPKPEPKVVPAPEPKPVTPKAPKPAPKAAVKPAIKPAVKKD
jgi:hypothetical protein